MIPTQVRFGALALILPALLACERTKSSRSVVAAKDVLVVTDGRFNEWGTLPVLFADPQDAASDAAVDIGDVRAADDSRWLHLAVEVRRKVNVQRMRGTLALVFDADGDSSTGGEVFAMPGVDLIVELSRRDRDPAAEVGAGNGVRPVTSAGPGEILPGRVVGLLSAPTYSASRFEIRLDRGVKLEGLPVLFAGDTFRMKIVFADAEGVRDETGVSTYKWAVPAGGAEPPVIEPWIAGTDNGFRVAYWNVAGETLRNNPGPYRRILTAIGPDVVLMDEVYESVTAEDLASFFGAGLLGQLGEWHFVVGKSGGRQQGVVAARHPIRPADELLDVAYPEAELDRLSAEIDDADFRALLEEERKIGLATAGAWVELGEGREAGREVLFVPLDFQSGGYDGSPEDRLRELQASTLRERVGTLVENPPHPEDGPLPLVVAGDLNLVGSAGPLDVLRRGLDAFGDIDLAISEAYRLTDRSQATWRDPGDGDYTPGRLDFLLFTTSRLESVRAFIFDTGELTEVQARRFGVAVGDSESASKHLPGVADFIWSRARQ